MKSEQYQNPYLDSSVFIAWIKGEKVDNVDRKSIVEYILKFAEKKVFKINVSTFTLVEVHKKKGAQPLNDEEGDRILAFFEHDFINIIDVDREIAEQANKLCRRYNLWPTDAIHLACAIRGKCDVLLAWDNKLTSINHPDIIVENPRKIGQLNLLDADNQT